MADLFPVGGPVPAEDVVDRAEFIEQVVTRLLDRHSVVLSAPRRLGKSSVAYEILRLLREEEDCYTAAGDLSTVSTVRDLAERLIAMTIASVAPGVRGCSDSAARTRQVDSHAGGSGQDARPGSRSASQQHLRG